MTSLPAGLLMGGLWRALGPAIALDVGAGLAGVASIALLGWGCLAPCASSPQPPRERSQRSAMSSGELRFRAACAPTARGVHFEGPLAEAARACLWTRVAARVLVEIASFEAKDADALYEGVRAVDWTPWLTPATTLAVRAACRSSLLTHTGFIAQKTKDAIVDVLRERLGSRPSVDRTDPDVGVAVHLAKDHATLYLDAGGGSLHERGWRSSVPALRPYARHSPRPWFAFQGGTGSVRSSIRSAARGRLRSRPRRGRDPWLPGSDERNSVSSVGAATTMRRARRCASYGSTHTRGTAP